jgi:hypothetical protein
MPDVKNAPIQGRFTDAFEKERAGEHKTSPWQKTTVEAAHRKNAQRHRQLRHGVLTS